MNQVVKKVKILQKLVISPKKQFLVKRFSQVNLAKNRNASALKSSDIKMVSQVPPKNNQMLLPSNVLISKMPAKFFNDSFHLKCRFSTKYIKTWPLFCFPPFCSTKISLRRVLFNKVKKLAIFSFTISNLLNNKITEKKNVNHNTVRTYMSHNNVVNFTIINLNLQ